MEKTQLPFSDGCFVCGIKNPMGLQIRFRNELDKVIAEFTPTEHQQGYKGVVHGGILCTLLDEAMGWAPTLVTQRMTVSAELNIRFIRPAPIGKKLIVKTQVEEINRRLYTAIGTITGEDGTVYVSGTGKFIPLSKEKTKEVDSWLLYDDETRKVFSE